MDFSIASFGQVARIQLPNLHRKGSMKDKQAEKLKQVERKLLQVKREIAKILASLRK